MPVTWKFSGEVRVVAGSLEFISVQAELFGD